MAVRPYTCLELCAGIGALGLGVELAMPGARAIAYVEREAYAAGILAARMAAGDLAPAAIWSDLATFDARPLCGMVDCVVSGDPCQDNSISGTGAGADGERFLVPDVVRIFDESGACRLFRENVTGNADGQLAAIIPALERLGCRVACGIFSALEVGGSQQRDRLFIMADRGEPPAPVASTDGARVSTRIPAAARGSEGQPGIPHDARGEILLFPPRDGAAEWARVLDQAPGLEPAVYRVADGHACRVDRVRALGNGVVPLVAAYAWRSLDALLAESRAAGAVAMTEAA